MYLKPLHLLLADDDNDDCLFFKEALEELQIDAELTIVNDGVQLMQHLSEKGHALPHVIYLDLNMPRKNGFECLTEIKKDDKLNKLPIIIFSTSYDMEVVNLTHDHGANFYICKPAEFSQLKKVISKSIEIISRFPMGDIPRDKFVLSPI
jgi:CheY-like chemotaxis protein